MKYLPKRFRETQVEWFSQTGFSWHVTTVEKLLIAADGTSYIQTDVFVSILDDDSRQDSVVTTAILKGKFIFIEFHQID